VIFRFAPDVVEETVAGDLVAQRRVSFDSQEDQIAFLRSMVTASAPLASIRARARDIVFRVHNAPQRNDAAYAVAIAKWVQAHIQYVKESPEVFQVPTATIAIGYGDCDDLVTVVCSLLEALGIESEIVGMEWAWADGRAFQHIFPRAVIPMAGGQKWRIPLDTSLTRPIEDLTDPIRVAMEAGHDLRIVVA
jgi:hypothetical protein